jgi:hypothetical protein
MADETSEPKFPRRPIVPRNATKLPLWSAVAALLLLLAGIEAYLAGWTRVASPGPLTSAHARIDATCAQCHGSTLEGVDPLRCERCHDPLDTRHLEPAAHVLVGTADEWKASHVTDVACDSCHIEHRGRAPERALQAAEDRQCATCHSFASFSAHPEFAIVRSAADSDTGLTLSHAGHLRMLAKEGTRRCEACHEATEDRRTFKPVSFDRHCASCHLKDGVLTMNRTDIAATGNVASALLAPAGPPAHGTLSTPDSRGRQTLTGFEHRDPWVVERLARLTNLLDPTGAATFSRRARLTRAISAAQSAAAIGALADLSAQDLDRWAQDLRADLAAIDRQQSAAPGAVAPETQSALKTLADQLAPNDPNLAANLSAAAARAAAPAADAPIDLDARRAELTALLDAIDQHGDAAAKKTAADLRKKMASLTASTGTASADDRRALLDRLASLEQAFGIVERQAGAMVTTEMRQLSDLVREQLTLGVAGPEFAARQAELVALLDALAARADEPQERRRIADLRNAVIQLGAGNHGDTALAERRADKARLLERVLIQRELSKEPEGPSTSLIPTQRASALGIASSLQAQMAALTPSAGSLPPISADPDTAKKGIRALLDACMNCHRLNADESAMRPVRASLTQLDQATFTHKDHVGQTRCESCHSAVETSTSSKETLIPGVATCQTCHKSGEARINCAGCHLYHSRPGATMGVALR